MLSEGQIEKITDLIQDTGEYIQSQARRVSERDVKSKDLNSFVSYVDREAEQRLVQGLERIQPGYGYWTEEETVARSTQSHRWIIDPLDGTTNFLHGLPAYAVSVALEIDRELQLGWVYHIPARQMYFARKGGGALLNGRPIHTSETTDLQDSLIATGFPYTDFSEKSSYMDLLAHLMPKTRGLRRWGSAAIDLVFTAAGQFQGFYELGLSAWDVAGGALIVTEAGGVVTDFSGSPHFMDNRQIIAAPPVIHRQLQAEIEPFFRKNQG